MLPHREIAVLDQGVAQRACQVDMLKIRGIPRPWRQEDDTRIVAMVGCQGLQGLTQGVNKRGETLYRHGAQDIGKGAGEEQARFQGISQPGWILRVIRQDTPLSIRGTCQIHRGQMQITPVGHGDIVAGAQESLVCIHQLRR